MSQNVCIKHKNSTPKTCVFTAPDAQMHTLQNHSIIHVFLSILPAFKAAEYLEGGRDRQTGRQTDRQTDRRQTVDRQRQ